MTANSVDCVGRKLKVDYAKSQSETLGATLTVTRASAHVGPTRTSSR